MELLSLGSEPPRRYSKGSYSSKMHQQPTEKDSFFLNDRLNKHLGSKLANGGLANYRKFSFSHEEVKGPAIIVEQALNGSAMPAPHDSFDAMDATISTIHLSQLEGSVPADDTTIDQTILAGDLDVDATVIPYIEPDAVTPQLFDELIPHLHSPSVARYAQFDGISDRNDDPTSRLIAALPTRIIAQIASDSFMDYELVSDFFLTYRSYLQPQRLLALLFARLEWALDRQTSDGRVARIRTFAALRHWVLNYFVDDFMHDSIGYTMRAAFCERLNSLYRKTRLRMSVTSALESGGASDSPAAIASDLKVLIDLKRCWIGRCAVYCNSASNNQSEGDAQAQGGIFSADQDIHPFYPPPAATTTEDTVSQAATAESHTTASKRLSRYSDVRSSHYGAFHPDDSTTLSPNSEVSYHATSSEPLAANGSERVVGQARRPSQRRLQPRSAGHVKTGSQGSSGSTLSKSSRHHPAAQKWEHSRTFSDSVRPKPSIVRRSMSLTSRARPVSHFDVPSSSDSGWENTGLARAPSAATAERSTLRPSQERSEPETTGKAASEPTPNLIRGTLVAPLQGIIHIRSEDLSALPSRSGYEASQNGLSSGLNDGLDEASALPAPEVGRADDEVAQSQRSADGSSTTFPAGFPAPAESAGVSATNAHGKTPAVSPAAVAESMQHAVATMRRSTTLPASMVDKDLPELPHAPEMFHDVDTRSPLLPATPTPTVKHLMGSLRRAILERKPHGVHTHELLDATVQQETKLYSNKQSLAALERMDSERLVEWLESQKGARVDLLAERAAKTHSRIYGDRASGVGQQHKASLLSPASATRSVQIQLPDGDEFNCFHITTDVQKAPSKTTASSSSDRRASGESTQPSSFGSSEAGLSQEISLQDQGKSQASVTGHDESVQAENLTVRRSKESAPESPSSTEGLGFGLDLSSRIPRRPSESSNTASTAKVVSDIPVKFISHLKPAQLVGSGNAPYPGPNLATVDSAAPSGRNSPDGDSSDELHGHLGNDQSEVEVEKTAREENAGASDGMLELERFDTYTSQQSQPVRVPERVPPKAVFKISPASDRGGAVSRGMKSLGNRLRKYASYQSGMSKLNFRRQPGSAQRLATQQRPGMGQLEPCASDRQNSQYGRTDHSLLVQEDTIAEPPNRALDHIRWNASAFDISSTIDENQSEELPGSTSA
ncbi:Guanine nucleotide exchange factor lte1, partial [Ascosphaera acerosa]